MSWWHDSMPMAILLILQLALKKETKLSVISPEIVTQSLSRFRKNSQQYFGLWLAEIIFRDDVYM